MPKLTPAPQTTPIATLTRFVLRHRRAVTLVWLVVTVVGIAPAGSAVKALSDQFSVPGREGYETNTRITREFGTRRRSTRVVEQTSISVRRAPMSRPASGGLQG